jgi:multicomponent K+:H+ antiporter subunit E
VKRRLPWGALPGLAAFGALVAFDVVVANLRIAASVLGPRRRWRPGFVTVPVALADERAVVLLAHAVTLTPGTLTADVAADRRTILVHALDAGDPAALVQLIQQRYERRLRRVFRC